MTRTLLREIRPWLIMGKLKRAVTDGAMCRYSQFEPITLITITCISLLKI